MRVLVSIATAAVKVTTIRLIDKIGQDFFFFFLKDKLAMLAWLPDL